MQQRRQREMEEILGRREERFNGHGQLSQHLVANGGLGQDASRQLTTPENDAMNAKVQQLVDMLANGRPFEAVPDPQTGEQHIFAVAADARRWPGPFGETNDWRSAHNGRSSSLDWETIYTVSDRPDKENEEPDITVEQRKDRGETCMAQAVRNTPIPHWIAKHLNKRKARAIDCPPTVDHHKEHLPPNPAPDHIASISLTPNVVIRAGDSGPEYHPISRIPINFYRTHRARTPSIQSNGSELDCSSPLFLKSCETAIRGNRDLGMLCGEIAPVGVECSVGSSERRRADAKVEAWLEDIHIEAAFGIGAGECIDTAGPSTPTALTRWPFQVLWELHDGAESIVSPSRIPVPVSKVLKDISNLRRPGYLAKNSFAKLEASQSQKAASRPLRTVESDPINKEKTGPSCPSKIPVPASTVFEGDSSLRPRYVAKNSFTRLEPAPTNRGVLELDPTTQTTLYRRARARTNKPDYMAVGTAPPPTDVKLRFPRPIKLKLRRKWKKAFPPPKRQEITPSMFTFEPCSERRQHFEFTLGRLEGRVDPPPPSPLQRFAHPLNHYSEHVDTEWMGMTTRHVRPVAKKVAPMNQDVGADAKMFGQSDGADDRVGKGEKPQGRAWMKEGTKTEAELGSEEETDSPGLTEDLDFESEEEIAAPEQRESVLLMQPAGGLLRRLIARFTEMVLEQLIEGMD